MAMSDDLETVMRLAAVCAPLRAVATHLSERPEWGRRLRLHTMLAVRGFDAGVVFNMLCAGQGVLAGGLVCVAWGDLHPTQQERDERARCLLEGGFSYIPPACQDVDIFCEFRHLKTWRALMKARGARRDTRHGWVGPPPHRRWNDDTPRLPPRLRGSSEIPGLRVFSYFVDQPQPMWLDMEGDPVGMDEDEDGGRGGVKLADLVVTSYASEFDPSCRERYGYPTPVTALDIVGCFDLTCCQVAFNGTTFHVPPGLSRGIFTLTTVGESFNRDKERLESRIAKYVARGLTFVTPSQWQVLRRIAIAGACRQLVQRRRHMATQMAELTTALATTLVLEAPE